MALSAWHTGLVPAETTVTCGDDTHRVEWRDGQLRTPDHADPEGERMLAALGGEACTCIELLDAWERHRDDLTVLVLARRGAADPLVPQEDTRVQAVRRQAAFQAIRQGGGRGFARTSSAGSAILRGTGTGGWWSYSPMNPGASDPTRMTPAERRERDLVALMSLGGGLPDRLVATVAAAWEERLRRGDAEALAARPRLHAALYGRMFAALRAWRGGGTATKLDLRLEMLDPGARPTMESSGDGVIVAACPFSWLTDVWIRDLATIWGRFCLEAVTEDDGRTWQLRTLNADLAGESSVMIAFAPR